MRKLRVSENNSNGDNILSHEEMPSERKLRMADRKLREKADRLLALKSQLAARERENKVFKDAINELQNELLEYGRDNNLESLTSDTALITFQSRTTRKIDPKSFLAFLANHGRTKEFYNFVDVPITSVIKNFGEAVLESSGVLTSTLHEYSGLKVSARE